MALVRRALQWPGRPSVRPDGAYLLPCLLELLLQLSSLLLVKQLLDVILMADSHTGRL